MEKGRDPPHLALCGGLGYQRHIVGLNHHLFGQPSGRGPGSLTKRRSICGGGPGASLLAPRKVLGTAVPPGGQCELLQP